MDATKDWEFEEGFDLIHVRMLGDMQAKGHLVESIYSVRKDPQLLHNRIGTDDLLHKNLNPGGWAEFTEWIVHVQSPDHSLDGGAFMRWNKVLRRGLSLPVHSTTQCRYYHQGRLKHCSVKL